MSSSPPAKKFPTILWNSFVFAGRRIGLTQAAKDGLTQAAKDLDAPAPGRRPKQTPQSEFERRTQHVAAREQKPFAAMECVAHLIREVKFLWTLPGREDQAYGQRLRDTLWDLFDVIHRRKKMTLVGFQKALAAVREQVLKAATTRAPDAKHARNVSIGFLQNCVAYFRFIMTPGLEPTNHLAASKG